VKITQKNNEVTGVTHILCIHIYYTFKFSPAPFLPRDAYA